MFLFSQILNLFFRLLFPSRCLGCRRFDAWLCDACLGSIPQQKPECPVCRQPSADFAVHQACREGTALDRVIVAAQFDEPLVSVLVHQLKYDWLEGLAEPAAKLIHRVWPLELSAPAVLVPIPLHKKRQRQRGFNQSRLIADELGRLTGLPVMDALRRTRSTTTQTALSKIERQANMRGVFAVQPHLDLQKKTVILVDDVTTTLSTLNEAALALRTDGCQTVWGAVAGRNRFDQTSTGNA